MAAGMEASLRFTVTDADTAAAVGSGSLPVLGTPRLLAWCEAATCAAIDPTLPEGSTSVGTRVELEHPGRQPGRRRGTGDRLRVVATMPPPPLDRRRHAPSPVREKVVGTAEITRLVVDSTKFLSRL